MSEQRWTINSGSKFEEMAGYSRAVIDGRWVFVSGTAGYNLEDGSISDDPVEQTRQCLRTIDNALQQSCSKLADIVRVRVFIKNREDVMAVSKVLGETFSDPRPTNTTILCGFAMEEMF